LSGGAADLVGAGDGDDLVFSGLGGDAVDGGAGNDLIVGNQYLLYDTTGSTAEDQQAWEDLQGRLGWANDGLDVTSDGFLRFAWHVALPAAPVEGVSRTDGTPFRYDPATGELHYLDAQGEVARTLSHRIRFGDWANADPKVYSGGAGNDLLAGADGDDALHGGADDDALAGNGGNDVLVGGDGSDWVIAGAGSDCLDGGAGADSLVGEDGGDMLWGGDGNDRLFGDSDDRPLTTHGSDRLYGGAGNDTLVGHGGDDVLDGEDGDDDLFGESGHDRLAGGSGVDRLQGGDGADLLDGGSGSDVLYGEAGDDSLVGGVGDDALRGADGQDLLSGGTGRDLLDGGPGNDTYLFRSGDGFDRLEDAAGGSRLVFGPGTELRDISLQSLGGDAFLVAYGPADAVQLAPGVSTRITEVRFDAGVAVSFDDLVATGLGTPLNRSGTNAADVLQGGTAADQLSGEGGDDRLAGGGGDDRLSGYTGADALYGDAGADVIDGGYGDDLLVGGPGDDTLYGNRGSDLYRFAPGDGRDTIAESSELGTTDALVFGDGIAPGDLRFSRQPSGDLLIDVGARGDSVTVRGWFTNPDQRIERIASADGQLLDLAFLDDLAVTPQTGTAGDDTLVGTAYADVIVGGAGDDCIDGMEGDDRLEGGPGDDTYVLGAHGGFDAIRDADGGGALVLERGLWLDELTRERAGDDLVLRLRGSEQTGVRIAGYYGQPAEWRVLTEAGAERAIEEIAEARRWGDAPDPVARAKADYLDALRADFLEEMIDSDYTRSDADTVERLPVAATVASYVQETSVATVASYVQETSVIVTDYAAGTVSQLQYTSVGGPTLERVRYASGQERGDLGDTILGWRVDFAVESLPLNGGNISVKSPFSRITQVTDGELWLTPESSTFGWRAPERYVTRTVSGTLPNGVSGVLLEDKTYLTAVTHAEGPLGPTGALAFPYRLYESRFVVERLTGDDGDNRLQTGRASHSILEGGAGNDTLASIGRWSWSE
ncbi:MAG: Ig family protein, partial [Acidobacteria bacterium]|nr:Ig family protein [Acidobacteriota bacterium]